MGGAVQDCPWSVAYLRYASPARETETLARCWLTLWSCGARDAPVALLRRRRRGAELHAGGGAAARCPAGAERADPPAGAGAGRGAATAHDASGRVDAGGGGLPG